MSWMLDLGVVLHVESWSSVIRCVCDEDCIVAELLQVAGRECGSNAISSSTLSDVT